MPELFFSNLEFYCPKGYVYALRKNLRGGKKRYRIIRSDGPGSNFNRIFALIKINPKFKPFGMYVVPYLEEGLL